MAIKLYGVPMSRALRCLWMLEELGVPYENVRVDFRGEAQKPEFLALNPNGRIPALDDDGLVLFESLAINLHLARKYDGGQGLWPKSADDQSRAIQWSIWAMTELEPPVMKATLHRAFLPKAERSEAEAQAAEAAFAKPLGVLEGVLAGRPHLLGDAFTAADLAVASVLSFGPTLGRLALTAAVAAWFARCNERPALARARGRR